MKPGIRVIRGPDWRLGNKDGGLGYLGTVIKLFPNNSVLVRWDVGSVTECRAGQDGAFDLRVYDNAPTGVVAYAFCDIEYDVARRNGRESTSNIPGFQWKCQVCHDTDLCTSCYHADKLDKCMNHSFIRLTTRFSTAVHVPPRKRSKKIPLYGIFPGAEVVKIGSTGEEDNQPGIVRELVDLQPDAHRSAVKVEWKGTSPKKAGENGTKDLPVYRVGADGKVELKMVQAESCGHVYLDHLPVLDLTMPVDVTFNKGDKVRVDLNLQTFEKLQREHSDWVPQLEKVLGEEGVVCEVDTQKRIVETKYLHLFGEDARALLYRNCLTKISMVSSGDTVKVIEDSGHMKRLQNGHGGWQHAYVSILGRIGKVIRIDESKDALVEVDGQKYVLNPDCLVVQEKAKLADPPGGGLKGQLVAASASMRRATKLAVPKSALRNRPPLGTSVGVGARVVRGPDWSPDFDKQDGGEGHVGSIVEICGLSDNDMYPKQCVVVQWDAGDKNVYRAGYEGEYDLRLYDNAGIGIVHETVCSECDVGNVLGILWRCTVCRDVALCSSCYHSDKHDIHHSFQRFESVEIGTNVPKRAMSKKLAVKGIFERCKVQRGPDWRWENQDGGSDKYGDVIAIVNFSPDTDRDGAEVTWENGYTNVYRLGYKGRLDLKCVKPATGGYYYKDHIPTLKIDTEPAQQNGKPQKEEVKKDEASADVSDGRFKEGDRVRIEIDLGILKDIEENRGAWNDHMTECIGQTGTVIVSKGNDITVDFERAGRWTFHESVLNKLKQFLPGETVQVSDSVDNIRMLQQERGGWNDLMVKVIGRKGVVEEIDEDGDVQVSFGEYTWVFNPECLTQSTGQPHSVEFQNGNQASEDMSRSAPRSGAKTEMDKLHDLFNSVMRGDQGEVERIINREPQLMLMDLEGDFAIHKACYCGHIPIVKTLFGSASKDVLMEVPDNEQNTPLLSAVKGGQIEMVTFLAGEGADKNVYNKSRQTAVHMAVTAKRALLLARLKDLGFDFNQKNTLDQSVVIEAILGGEEQILRIVLNVPGVEVEYQDSIGFTPFCYACRSGNVYAVKRILELAPKQLNEAKLDTYTGLHVAAVNNKLDVLKMLTLKGDQLNINATTSEGRTALHLACVEGYIDVAKLLISRGAKLTVDNFGKSCLHLCVDIQEDKVNCPEKSDESVLAMVDFLLDAGVQSTRDAAGKIPAHYVPESIALQYKALVEKKMKSAMKTPAEKSRAVTEERRQRSDQAVTEERRQRSDQAVTEERRQRSDQDGPTSLPAGIGKQRATPDRQDEGPKSMININMTGGSPVATSSGEEMAKPKQSPLIQDYIEPDQQQQVQPPATANDDDEQDSDMCQSCEEEPYRFLMEPCKHHLCADCIPPKKQKKKKCCVCSEPVLEIVEAR